MPDPWYAYGEVRGLNAPPRRTWAPLAAANSALYGVSKAALIYMSKAMAFELAKDNIMVNAVSPGPIETEFTRERMEKEPGHRELRASQIPLHRWGKPEEIGYAAVFLASNRAAYVTGQVISVSGGFGV